MDVFRVDRGHSVVVLWLLQGSVLLRNDWITVRLSIIFYTTKSASD